MKSRISVKYATPKDMLGRVKAGWYVMDEGQFCGRHDSEAEAEKAAAGLRKIRGESLAR